MTSRGVGKLYDGEKENPLGIVLLEVVGTGKNWDFIGLIWKHIGFLWFILNWKWVRVHREACTH